MKVSGQPHVPAGLPSGKHFFTYWIGGWVDPRAGVDVLEKSLALNNLRYLLIYHINFQNYTLNDISPGVPKKDALSPYYNNWK
jgi:hypothetical protein